MQFPQMGGQGFRIKSFLRWRAFALQWLSHNNIPGAHKKDNQTKQPILIHLLTTINCNNSNLALTGGHLHPTAMGNRLLLVAWGRSVKLEVSFMGYKTQTRNHDILARFESGFDNFQQGLNEVRGLS
jgi:hypothetical protein